MSARTDLPGVGTVWRDRWAPKRTVRVTGAGGETGPVVSETLTDGNGDTPATLHTNHTVLREWDWHYEQAGLGARS